VGAEERDGEFSAKFAGKQQSSAFAGVGRRALARRIGEATKPAKTGRETASPTLAPAEPGQTGGAARSEPLRLLTTGVDQQGLERRLGQTIEPTAALNRQKKSRSGDICERFPFKSRPRPRSCRAKFSTT